ncbi:NmrA family NAD(P)-binding protein [Paraburkholderia phenoliruptrix]|uniref:NmrA family NAD(P)-binding protein n=1 Tax=Paraburkholderia phenoliruptrix TaxID=252970 RepID=UPI001C6E96A6|nr:NmrA family NAD(P)-binding protein [Paraburkholderia phenoliruptrix]MBW9107437.1 NmrA family NAD(P)-binding protein [Paraburkholderia phenoliruptrix]MBW9128141.1 NmrA family NAD(P)-binding protein [Paraburkholderia ginsengiterrae]
MTANRVLIFGASGHLSLPVARWINYRSPQTLLRLATRSEVSKGALARLFPNAELVTADYLDPESLAAAFSGVTEVFVVTPDFLDEDRAMTNLVNCARQSKQLRLIVRILGNLPNVTLDNLTPELRNFGGGTATQHFLARSILDASGLPVTYLNMSAYLMDDLVRWSGPIRQYATLLMPYERRVAWVDPEDVGEAAARIILSGDRRYVGQHFNVESGQDILTFRQVAEMLSDVLHSPIAYDDSVERWLNIVGPRYNQIFGAKGADYYLQFYRFEQLHELAVCTSNSLGMLLQRPPTTLRSWIKANTAAFDPPRLM